MMATSNLNTMLSNELRDLDAHRDEGNGSKSLLEVWWRNVRLTYQILKVHPSIAMRTFLAFGILCCGGLAILIQLDASNREELEETALELAVETGRWFCKCTISY